MTVSIKDELLCEFQSTKFGQNLDGEQEILIFNFYNFLKSKEFERKIRDCEMKLAELLFQKYRD